MANSAAIDVMRYALQQYGYTESPAGSNRNKFGKAFGFNGVPWCAEYVWYCGEQAKGDNPIYKSANAADIEDLTVKHKGGKYILKQTANNDLKKAALPKYKFGDIISFNFSGKTSRAHTALVVGVSGNNIYCMEGNTSFSDAGSQSNGGCVALRARNYTTGVCIVRPKYTAQDFYKPTKPYTGDIPTLPDRGYFKYGDKGKQVKKLQRILAWVNGYNLKADGKFGAGTLAEVVIFQVANGLTPDGEFGEMSWKKTKKLVNSLNSDATQSDTAQKPTESVQTDESTKVDTKVNEESKSEVSKKPPKLYVPLEGDKCYDLSAWQGELSVSYFKGIKKKGITCVILRSSYSKMANGKKYVDKVFANNIKNAIKAGLHIGIYHFSSAIKESESKSEGKFCLKHIEPYMEYIDLPVAFDCEFGTETSDGDPRFTASVAKKIGKTGMGKIVDAFCDVVKDAGYTPMLYANLSMFNNYLPANIYKKYRIWIAQYNSTCDYKHSYYMWQYTSNNGKLDENIFGKQDTNSAKKTKLEKIYDEAKACAYPYGTSKKTCGYPDGKPREHYKKSLNKAYPDRSKWGKQTRAGASCDVFVGTVIRASGVDSKFPRGLDEVEPYMKTDRGKKLWKKTDVKNKSKMKKGDIIYELYSGGGGHISVFMGGDRVANAHYNGKTYPVIEAYSKQIHSPSKCKKFIVYRPKG